MRIASIIGVGRGRIRKRGAVGLSAGAYGLALLETHDTHGATQLVLDGFLAGEGPDSQAIFCCLPTKARVVTALRLACLRPPPVSQMQAPHTRDQSKRAMLLQSGTYDGKDRRHSSLPI
jgi:hypothetical protein